MKTIRASMHNTKITGRTDKGKQVEGIIRLVYQEAIASGTNEYVQITMLLVEDEDGLCHNVRPRDVIMTHQ